MPLFGIYIKKIDLLEFIGCESLVNFRYCKYVQLDTHILIVSAVPFAEQKKKFFLSLIRFVFWSSSSKSLPRYKNLEDTLLQNLLLVL